MPAKVGGANNNGFNITIEDDASAYEDFLYSDLLGGVDLCKFVLTFQSPDGNKHTFPTKLVISHILFDTLKVVMKNEQKDVWIGNDTREHGHIRFIPSANTVKVEILINDGAFHQDVKTQITRKKFIKIINGLADQFFALALKYEIYRGDSEDLKLDGFYKAVYKQINEWS